MLENENIGLRVIDENDIRLIQQWHNNYEITKFTTLDAFIPRNYMEESSWFERKMHDKTSRIFMIVLKETERSVGFISYSNMDNRNQKTYLSIVIGNQDMRGKGIGHQAVLLLEEWLKHEFHIRKVTVQILSFNHASLSLFKKLGYVEEGILKEEVYRSGTFHNLYLLSKFLEG